MEEIRSYVSDGSFQEKIPLLLRQWNNNANRGMEKAE
jgi:hypothetical protein